jgi:hypothetical protein
LAFQYVTYKKEPLSYNTHRIPVTLIITCNCPEADFPMTGYDRLFAGYRESLERSIGPTKSLVSSETWQVSEADYKKYDWTMFDVEARHARRQDVFPQEKEQAFALGAGMVR